MVRPRYKPVTPDQRIRELRKEFKSLRKEEPGPDRARRLAAFSRAAYAERQLNMAMHTAQLCLEEDPDAPELLVAAYLGELDTGEDDEPVERHGPASTEADEQEWLLRSLDDLADLARYLDRDDIEEQVADRLDEEAREWIREADEHERRHRLRTLSSMISREFADTIRDELRFLE